MFPEGEIIDGGWTIRDTLCGSQDRGMFRAASEGRRTLVTMGTKQRGSLDELRRHFGYATAGVAPFVGIARVALAGAEHDVLIEAEPGGAPLTQRVPSDRVGVARGLAATVARAHADGHLLCGLRPELVYSDGATFTGVAPRAEPFLAGVTPPSYGVPPCFDEIYMSPEALSMLPTTTASDVFALCATLAYLLTGAPPFEGATLVARLGAAMRGEYREMMLPEVVLAGLARSPTARPSAADVEVALTL